MASVLYAGSFLIAAIVALAATPLVGIVARRLDMLDVPGGRRHHPRPIPRPGGLAVFIAFGCAIALFWGFDALVGTPYAIPEDVRSPRFRLVVLAAVVGVVVGFIDDYFELRARWQLLGQLAIALIVVLGAGVAIDYVKDPLDPGRVVFLGALVVPISLLWIVGMINALNFIDGLDGLATGVSAIAAIVLGVVALVPPIVDPFVAWMEFTLAGALVGFLFFNFHPARIFLGTTGVTFVGTMMATLAVFGSLKVDAALLVLGVPIIDTFYVIVRRLASRRPPFAPDRGHFHHRLLDVGLSHGASVVLIYAITGVLGAIALLASGQALLLAFVAAFVLFGIAILTLSQRGGKARELEPDPYPDDGPAG